MWIVPVEDTSVFIGAGPGLLANYVCNTSAHGLAEKKLHPYPSKNERAPAGRAYCVEKDVTGSCENPEIYPTAITCAIVDADGGRLIRCVADVDYVRSSDVHIYCSSEESSDAENDCAVFFTVEHLYTVMSLLHLGSTLFFVVVVAFCTFFVKKVRDEVSDNIRYICATYNSMAQNIKGVVW